MKFASSGKLNRNLGRHGNHPFRPAPACVPDGEEDQYDMGMLFRKGCTRCAHP